MEIYHLTFFYILSAVFIINVLIDIVIFWPILLKRKKDIDLNRALPVSVVVCAWDECENLKVLLPLLFGQNHQDFEVVVVNDRSTDETYDFLRELSYTEQRLKVVNVSETPEGMSAKKYALTLGFKAAKNEILLLTDADCIPNSEDWVSTMANAYQHENHEIVLSYSGYAKEKGFLNKFIQYETLYTALQFLGLANLRFPYMGVGRNLSYKKSLFFKSGGFRSILSYIAGDDDLFVQKVSNSKNTTISLDAKGFTTSIPKKTWKEYIVQKKRHLSVGRFYKGGIRLVLATVFLSSLVFWVLAGMMVAYENFMYWVAGMVGFRILSRVILFCRANKVFKSYFEWYWSPLIEAFYIFYYIVAGLVTLKSKKVTWK